MFRQIGIYASKGQLYDPQDAGELMYYREDKKGQILEEGINEAGAYLLLGSGWHVVFESQRSDGAVLHLLLDVWFSAHW